MTKGDTASRGGEAPSGRRAGQARAQLATVAAAKPGAVATPKPPRKAGIAGAIVDMTEETRGVLQDAIGTKNISFNTNLFVRTARTAFVFHGADVHPGAEDQLNQTATLVAIKAFKPTDPVEAMIAAQAVMLHHLAMEAGRRAQLPDQSPDVASKLRKDAANSARSMVEMCEALDRRRGKGPQRIVVERVQVAAGGQAIVGAVTAAAPLPASAPTPQAIGQGPASMAMLDAEPVEAGVGEGERDAGSDT